MAMRVGVAAPLRTLRHVVSANPGGFSSGTCMPARQRHPLSFLVAASSPRSSEAGHGWGVLNPRQACIWGAAHGPRLGVESMCPNHLGRAHGWARGLYYAPPEEKMPDDDEDGTETDDTFERDGSRPLPRGIEEDGIAHLHIQHTLLLNRTAVVKKGGKVMSFSAVVVCGNGKGVAAIGKGKDKEAGRAVEKAIRRAHKPINMHYFELYDLRTVFHDVTTKFKRTKIIMMAAQEGTGLLVNNTINLICEAIGIQDLKAKIHGSHNTHNTVAAFWKALKLVQTPEEVARKRGKAVVDMASLRAGLGPGHTTLFQKSWKPALTPYTPLFQPPPEGVSREKKDPKEQLLHGMDEALVEYYSDMLEVSQDPQGETGETEVNKGSTTP